MRNAFAHVLPAPHGGSSSAIPHGYPVLLSYYLNIMVSKRFNNAHQYIYIYNSLWSTMNSKFLRLHQKYSQERKAIWGYFWTTNSGESCKQQKLKYLDFKVVWEARSLDEYFWEGPKIRVPPCSLPPLAGAHVGRAAVVMPAHCSLNNLGNQKNASKSTTTKHLQA